MIRDLPLNDLGDRLSARAAGGRFPWACQWELTCRCNLRCTMCYTDCFNTPEKIRQELTTAEIFDLLLQLQAAGCIQIVFTGGEPLARPDFAEIYTYAHGLGFVLTVFTNGALVTESIADLFVRLPPLQVEISLHGVSAHVFEEITQKQGSFEQVWAGIRRLHEREVPLVLKTVAMTSNQAEIVKLKSAVAAMSPTVALRIGTDLRADLSGSTHPSQFELTEDQLAEAVAGDSELASELPRVPRKECAGGDESFHIDAYGFLHRCTSNRRQGYDLRKGSFAEGFYNAMPSFPCPRRTEFSRQALIQLPILEVSPC